MKSEGGLLAPSTGIGRSPPSSARSNGSARAA